jgi:hypothetical protein
LGIIIHWSTPQPRPARGQRSQLHPISRNQHTRISGRAATEFCPPMPFAIRNLAGLAYAGNVTLWRYRSATDTRAALEAPGYFAAAGHLLRAGDMMLASAADGPLMLSVQVASPGAATLVNARGTTAPPPPTAALAALLGGRTGLVATLTAGTATASAPAAPSIAGLTLAWDINFGAPAAGAFPAAIVSQAGTETTAQAVVGGGTPSIITMGNGRRAADLNGAGAWIAMQNAVAMFATADAPFTLAVVAWRDTAGVTQGVADLHRGTTSNAGTIWRHNLLWTAANGQVWRRCDAANNADATISGPPSTTAPNIYVLRSNLAGDTIARGMANGGAKISSTAKPITATTGWTGPAFGARMISNTAQDFLDGKIERAFLYAGAATDANMDAIQSALASHYVA